jgi:hypothetical protein
VAELYVLIHAPVLGPASWRPVGAELSRAGHRVTVPSLAAFSAGGPPYAPRLVQLCAKQVKAAAAQQAPEAGPGSRAAGRPAADAVPDRVVLVLHSGAGPFAGQLAAAVGAGSVAAVFADAGLPARSGASPVVDARFLPYLREIASDGMVPPWPQWWPGADPAELYPNNAARVAVLADARPLPLSFFEETVPPAAATRPLRDAGYLLFSDGYRPEADEARSRGWPVTELAGSHLHPLVRPAEVAAAIVSLAQRPGSP